MAAEGNETGQKTSGQSSTLYFNDGDDFKKIMEAFITEKLAMTDNHIKEIQKVLSKDSGYAKHLTQEQLTVNLSKAQYSRFFQAFPRLSIDDYLNYCRISGKQGRYSITANYMTWALLLGNDDLALLLLEHGDVNQINADIKLQPNSDNHGAWKKEHPHIVVNPIVIAVLLGKPDFIKGCYAKSNTTMPKIVKRNDDPFYFRKYETLTQGCLIEVLFDELVYRIENKRLTLSTVFNTLTELFKKPITKDTFFGFDDMPNCIINDIIRLRGPSNRTVALCEQVFEVYKNFRKDKRRDRFTLRTALRTKDPQLIDLVLPWFTDVRGRSVDCETLIFAILTIQDEKIVETLLRCENVENNYPMVILDWQDLAKHFEKKMRRNVYPLEAAWHMAQKFKDIDKHIHILRLLLEKGTDNGRSTIKKDIKRKVNLEEMDLALLNLLLDYELCQPIGQRNNTNELNKYEQFIINTLDPDQNILNHSEFCQVAAKMRYQGLIDVEKIKSQSKHNYLNLDNLFPEIVTDEKTHNDPMTADIELDELATDKQVLQPPPLYSHDLPAGHTVVTVVKAVSSPSEKAAKLTPTDLALLERFQKLPPPNDTAHEELPNVATDTDNANVDQILHQLSTPPNSTQPILGNNDQVDEANTVIIGQAKKQGSPISGSIPGNRTAQKKKKSQERKCILEPAC